MKKAEICDANDILAIEDLAYIGMDFRKDYSVPFSKPTGENTLDYQSF